MGDVPMEVSGSEADIMGPSDEDIGAESTLLPFEVLKRIEKSWLNEKNSPELQVPVTEEVEVILDQLRIMEENVSRLSKADVKTSLHQLEVERIRFMIASYLRTRLAKIQEFGWHIEESENSRKPGTASKLTPEENKFLREYNKILEGHLIHAGMKDMPAICRNLTPKQIAITPNLDSFVFFRVNRDVDIRVDDADGEQIVELKEGDQYLMRYRNISSEVKSGAVELV